MALRADAIGKAASYVYTPLADILYTALQWPESPELVEAPENHRSEVYGHLVSAFKTFDAYYVPEALVRVYLRLYAYLYLALNAPDYNWMPVLQRLTNNIYAASQMALIPDDGLPVDLNPDLLFRMFRGVMNAAIGKGDVSDCWDAYAALSPMNTVHYAGISFLEFCAYEQGHPIKDANTAWFNWIDSDRDFENYVDASFASMKIPRA